MAGLSFAAARQRAALRFRSFAPHRDLVLKDAETVCRFGRFHAEAVPSNALAVQWRVYGGFGPRGDSNRRSELGSAEAVTGNHNKTRKVLKLARPSTPWPPPNRPPFSSLIPRWFPSDTRGLITVIPAASADVR